MTNEELCTMIKSGSKQAEDELLRQNMGYVRKTAYELYGSYAGVHAIDKADVDDMIQEALMALLRAAKGFSADNGNGFMAYAGKAVINSMLGWLRMNRRPAETELDALPEDSVELTADKDTEDADLSLYHNTPERIVLKKEQRKLLRKAVLSLPDRNRGYLAYRIGFGKAAGHSMKQAQEHFGLTAGRVRALEKQTLDMIKRIME